MGKKIKSGDVSASTEYKFSCATCVSRRDAHQQRFEQREGPRCDARQLGLIFTRHCLRVHRFNNCVRRRRQESID